MRRRGRSYITVMDAVIVAIVGTIIAACAVPLIEAMSSSAKSSTLRENLRLLRAQIEYYKAEHGGRPPLVVDGSLPQLYRATNSLGAMGEKSTSFPLGPYLKSGVPVNPLTGRSIVTVADELPPKKPSGAGGWLYHPKTGWIGIDAEGHLED